MATRFTPKAASKLKRGDAVELTVLPATVLAPLSVTAEQVALITDPRYPDGRAFGPVFTDSVHEAFRRGVDTALAAMGIPVVDGE